MLILSNEDIGRLLSLTEIIEAVEDALLALEKDTCMVPERMHLDWEDNSLLLMPALSSTHYGTKLVSVIPSNSGNSLPVTNGAMVLNDRSTGLPVAFFNASRLTALRTGALGAVGLKYLTHENSDTIGLIGSGIQGMHQAIFACNVRPIKKVFVLVHPNRGLETFTTFVHQYYPKVEVIACNEAEELLRQTEIVITATTAQVPVLPENKELLQGKHFFSIGSFKPSMQELPDAVYELANQLVIDSESARHEAGDTINPVQKGLIAESEIFTIGKLINKTRQADIAGTTVFKSTGMALFDLFVAQAMYKAAIKNSIGTEISF